MKRLMKILTFLMVFVAVFFSNTYAHSPKNLREIDIAGIIIDSKTKQPITGAEIMDEHNNVIAHTDDKGYFSAKLSNPEKGEIDFSFIIRKKGYRQFVQKEHWGDLKNPGAIYYFGIRKKWRINSDSFSKMLPVKGSNVNFENVIESFTKQ